MAPNPWAIALALLVPLAGCSAPPNEPPAGAEGLPAPHLDSLPFDAMVYPGGPGGCDVASCWVAAYPHLVFRVPMDAVLQAVDLDVGAIQGVDRVQWELTCVHPLDDGEEDLANPCQAPLAEGEGQLPTTVSVAGLAIAPRTALLLKLTFPAVEPAVDAMYSAVTRGSHVTGNARIERLPEALIPPIILVPEPLMEDRHSGPCVIVVEPDCVLIGGGYLWDESVEGNVYAFNLTMTWDSTSPVDARLGIRVGGRGADRGPDFVFVGTSPLMLNASAVEFGPEVFFIAFQPEPTGTLEGGGVRTPIHLEGTLWVEPWPALEE